MRMSASRNPVVNALQSTTQAPSQTSSTSPWLWGVLVLTVGMTVWTAMQEDDTREVIGQHERQLNSPMTSKNNAHHHTEQRRVVHAQLNEATVHPISASDWKIKARTALSQPPKDLFFVHAWVAPVVKSNVKPAPPPPPVAPEAPFYYIGKLEDSEQSKQFFLLAQNKVYNVPVGTNINAEWRLDGENEQFLQLTYLPLGLPQTLSKLKKQAVEPQAYDALAAENH